MYGPLISAITCFFLVWVGVKNVCPCLVFVWDVEWVYKGCRLGAHTGPLVWTKDIYIYIDRYIQIYIYIYISIYTYIYIHTEISDDEFRQQTPRGHCPGIAASWPPPPRFKRSTGRSCLRLTSCPKQLYLDPESI